ncbi:PTS sugar transporter subunit IIC [Lacrimispora sp. 38-1]|uniref:PTS sugar transporter subunit IIC n=1 Tax=Lacrimispora sp. 38-1 TaxID=3125778 RepID=UPI003CE8799C
MPDKKNAFTQTFQMKLSRFASAMGNNIYIVAIRDAMLAYVPFTFIASIFLILAFFPLEGFNQLVSSVLRCEAAVWQGKLLYVYNSSIAIGGLLVAITISHSIAGKMKLNQLQVTLTALVNYLILTPNVMSDAGNAISLTSVSAQAMFCAILTGLFTAKIYQIIDRKGIKIKMPESVPPAVSAPFESLIPSLIAIIIFWALRLITDALGTDAVSMINNTLGLPLVIVGGSVFGVAFAKIFEQLLWFFGLHGGSIVSGVMTPILQVLEDQNKNLSMAGDLPVNIISNSFFTHFAGIGVVGGVIAALIIARSRQYREISKIAIVPYFFGVGEPALFGFPMMLNFDLVVPFLLSNAVSAIVAYIAFAVGLVPITTGLVQLPWTTPIIISGFLVTGSIRGAILQLVLLVLVTLIWMPFIKIADKKNLDLEREV